MEVMEVMKGDGGDGGDEIPHTCRLHVPPYWRGLLSGFKVGAGIGSIAVFEPYPAAMAPADRGHIVSQIAAVFDVVLVEVPAVYAARFVVPDKDGVDVLSEPFQCGHDLASVYVRYVLRAICTLFLGDIITYNMHVVNTVTEV